LCGTGTREAIVSECDQYATGICSGFDSQPDLAPVNEVVAARWLEMQQNGCQDPDYTSPFGPDNDYTWRPAFLAAEETGETWDCSTTSTGGTGNGNGGSGELPDAAAPDDLSVTPAGTDSSDSGGCASVPQRGSSRSAALALMLIAIGVHWRRARDTRRQQLVKDASAHK
jgi:hypothetical protein